MANPTIAKRNFIQSILETDIPTGITLSKLAPGTNGHVLQTVGGVVTSAIVSDSNITNNTIAPAKLTASATVGHVVQSTGSATTSGYVTDSNIANDTIAVTKIAKSTANYVMKTNSGGTATEQGLLTTSNLSASANIAGSQLAAAAGITGAQIVSGAALDSPALTTPTISTLTTAGDTLYSSGSGVLVRLPKGTSRQILQQNTGLTAPEWVASPQSLMTAQGDILYASAANTPAALPAGTKGYALLTGGSGANPSYGPIARKNLLLNGSMSVSQRIALATATVAADVTYQVADRWKTIRDTVSGAQTVTNSQALTSTYGTTYTTGGVGYNSMHFNVTTSGGKFGAVQWLEASESIPLRSQTVSLQCKLGPVADNSITDVRMAVIYWTSTVDAPTSDPVNGNNWSVAGTNPLLITNIFFANTPTSAATGIMTPTVGANGALYKVEGISIPSNAVNVGVMFWVDDTSQSVGAGIWITDIQLELGSICTQFERRPYSQELAICQRYYREYGGENANEYVAVGETESTTLAYVPLLLSPPMRIAPSVAVSAAADWALRQAAGDTACSAVTSASVGSADCILISTTTASGLTAGRAVALKANNTTAARLKLDSEL